MARRFDILDRNTRQYRWYNAVGMQITARLIPPSDKSDPVTHFVTGACTNNTVKTTLRA